MFKDNVILKINVNVSNCPDNVGKIRFKVSGGSLNKLFKRLNGGYCLKD